MRHQCRVPQLGRPADQRKAMLRGLTTQLIREGRVTTTKARAKALRDEAERMITLAKEGSTQFEDSDVFLATAAFEVMIKLAACAASPGGCASS